MLPARAQTPKVNMERVNKKINKHKNSRYIYVNICVACNPESINIVQIQKDFALMCFCA